MRVDKYLWCVRLFKTRSIASKEVEGGKVHLYDEQVKSSKSLKVGDEFSIKHTPVWRSYKVLGFPKSRVGAKLVAEYLNETTSEADLLMIEEVQRFNSQNRLAGIIGRPTKKDRRDLDKFRD